MDIATASKQELIQSIIKTLTTTNIKVESHSVEDDDKYSAFIKDAYSGKDSTVQLPLDYALKADMFELIKSDKVFIDSSVKFIATFTTCRPTKYVKAEFNAKFIGNEFMYSFLDNHPGIINVDRLKDIPVDYEGLMAVPPTILEFKNLYRFNIHRVIYSPRYNGKMIYARVVISNKVVC